MITCSIQFLASLDNGISVPFWLNGLMPFSSPFCMEHSIQKLSPWQLASSKLTRERESYTCNHIFPVTSAIANQQKVSHGSCSPSRRGNHTEYEYQDGGIIIECICYVTLFSQFPNKCTSDRGDISYMQLLPEEVLRT